MQLLKPLSHRTGELGDVAGTLATHHCQLCQHLLAGMSQQGADYPRTALVMLVTRAYSNCSAPSFGELGVGGVLWELRDKWAGSLLASNAEVGWAGCRDAGAREASRASQLQQPSTEQLECILGVAEASPSCLGFFYQVCCS